MTDLKLTDSILIKKTKYYIIPLIYLIVIIPSAYYFNIWIDEVYSLNTTSHNLSYTIAQSLSTESQPPLYFILLFFWRQINSSIFFSRLLSIIFIVITLLLIPGLSRRYVPKLNPLWFQLLVFLHPTTFWMGIEIRCYALVLLISALMLLLYYDAYLTGSHKIKLRILYVLLGIAGIFMQYYFSFFLFAGAFPFLLKKKWNTLKIYLIDMILPLISIAVILNVLLHQINTYENLNVTHQNFLSELFAIYRLFETHILALRYINAEDTPIYKYIIRIIILSGLVILYYKKLPILINKLKSDQSMFIQVIVFFILFYSVQLIYGGSFLFYKYSLVAFFVIWIFWLNIATLNNKKFILYLNIIVFLITIIATLNKPLVKENDYPAIASYIETHESTNQPILIYRNETAMTFGYCYNGINKIIPIPFKIDFTLPYDPSLWIIKSPEHIKSFFKKIDNENIKRYWLVTDGAFQYYGVSFNYEILEDFIKQNFIVLEKKRIL